MAFLYPILVPSSSPYFSSPNSFSSPIALLLLILQTFLGVLQNNMGQIQYSDKYFDDTFEYRHVVLTPEVAKILPKNRILTESEWRAIGVQQSRGWVHYAIHRPEPHIMLFRRPLNYQQDQAQNVIAK